MKEKLGSLCVLWALLATSLTGQVWRGDEAVSVQVNDAKGRPLGNARVVFTFQGLPGETGPDVVASDGKGRAVLADLAPGPWQVEITHPDFLSYIAMLDVRRGKKPLVSASFLEAGGRSLTPVKVKFSKGDRQQASPVLEARQPVETPPSEATLAEEQQEPAARVAETPESKPAPEQAPPAPKPEPEPSVPIVEPAVEETHAPIPEAPAEQPRIEDAAPAPTAATPPPEPEPEVEQPKEPQTEVTSPPIPVVEPAVEPVVEETHAPTPEAPAEQPRIEDAAPAPTAATPPPEPEPEVEQPKEPQTEVTSPPIPVVEPAVEPVVEETHAPTPEAPAEQPRIEDAAPAPTAATPPPEPEPAVEEPEEPRIEATAPQVPVVEPAVEEAQAPISEAPAEQPRIEDVAPAPTAAMPPPEPEPELEPEPVQAPVVKEQEVAPPTPQPQPSTAPPVPVEETRPTPTPEPAEIPQEVDEPAVEPPIAAAPSVAVAASPPPPDPGARVTSHSDGSCQDCESAEWTLQVSVAAPAAAPGSAGRCGPEVIEAAKAAMQGLSTSIQLELDGFIGPVANGSSQEAVRRIEDDLAAPFSADLASFVGGRSPCQVVALVLPKAVRFSRLSLAAADQEGAGNCAPGQTCSIGDASWIGGAMVERGPSATIVYGLFENRSPDRGRRGILKAYYRPPNANWKPRLPPAD